MEIGRLLADRQLKASLSNSIKDFSPIKSQYGKIMRFNKYFNIDNSA
jgi:hypothetical protein